MMINDILKQPEYAHMTREICKYRLKKGLDLHEPVDQSKVHPMRKGCIKGVRWKDITRTGRRMRVWYVEDEWRTVGEITELPSMSDNISPTTMRRRLENGYNLYAEVPDHYSDQRTDVYSPEFEPGALIPAKGWGYAAHV